MSDTLPQDLEKGQTAHNIDYNSSTEYDHIQSNGAPNPITKITTSPNGDIVYLGNQSFHRHELLNAFAGDLNPGIHHTPHRPMGNPVPLGLSGFAVCCFVVSMVNMGARDVTNVKIIASCSLFFGGVIEVIAGLWCLVIENTFAATALGSYGGFWMSYGAINIDAFGIVSSYETTEEFNNAMGIFLIAWFIFSFIMWVCTFKATWPFFFLFLFLWTFILMLAIGAFTGSTGCNKAGGALGILATFTAFYIILAGTATPENSYIPIRSFPMPGAPRI
ncbi:Glyoxylate pathway regulator [Wickerhamomyces ciferrii]|uniref:Glyoxylate pathway regulator n=1 Tax=Wickerhamomyces ciferrii (strain ATCC 14091 / BCRC 22168 / CBS 111 / JCM 3599 / NBRC 0793 / NRRL Y-1031 F-60-10) TaxID=1206466 RepID=K0KJH5_WICCF|nr:Glyoxylate pathway regulator [Wickerhamomyces ciferrii]CCH41253.1 Glyoxylate pathway regulator [Wickerhamomyces ciferrii]